MPLASIINYATVSGLNVANGVATPLATGTAPHITLQADVSATDLVADVLGYYNVVSCQAGQVKAGGLCYELAFRPFLNAFAAADACKAVSGRLPTPMELRAHRGGNPLTLEFAGEWTDSLFTLDNMIFLAMLVADDGAVLALDVTVPRPFRCVFQPLP
jgi:hypothetical protein